MSDTVGMDMVVSLEYVLKLEDGQEIDRSDEGDPLEYLHGHRNIIPGLENQLEGMRVGESKEVAVSPAGEVFVDREIERGHYVGYLVHVILQADRQPRPGDGVSCAGRPRGAGRFRAIYRL